MELPCPCEVLNVFGGKSKSNAPKAFKFGTKRVPIEVNNWWKFGADISNHFWEIENWNFFDLNSPPSWKENSFWKLFLYIVGDNWKNKNLQFWISQKWFKISTPNFHQLFTSIVTRFVPNLYRIWISRQKRLKLQMGVAGPFFEPCPSNLVRIYIFQSCKYAKILVTLPQTV